MANTEMSTGKWIDSSTFTEVHPAYNEVKAGKGGVCSPALRPLLAQAMERSEATRALDLIQGHGKLVLSRKYEKQNAASSVRDERDVKRILRKNRA